MITINGTLSDRLSSAQPDPTFFNSLILSSKHHKSQEFPQKIPIVPISKLSILARQ